MRKLKEKIAEKTLLVVSLISVLALGLIGVFIFREGWPAIRETGLLNFIFGTTWEGTKGIFGVGAMIIGSVLVTFVALVIGVPLGLAVAVFLAEIAPTRIARLVRPATTLLAVIPSVVYGLFGLIIVVPFVRFLTQKIYGSQADPLISSGYGVLAAAIILAIMILPTIVNIAEDAIRAVPREYKEGSLALGATHWQTIIKVLMPAAGSGIVAGVVLAMGRAIGETMAVIMVAGNAVVIPISILSKVRTLTGNIAIEMSYAQGLHSNALFATGIVLFVFIMLINALASYIIKRGGIINE